MDKNIDVTGLNEINKNLKEFIENKKLDIRGGLKKGAQLVINASNDLVPVDSGFLRASSFTKIVSHRSVSFGYTAKYAKWVHEMPMTLKGQPRADFGKTSEENGSISFGGGTGKGNYWDSGENKFLSKALNRNVDEVTKIVMESGKPYRTSKNAK